MTIMIEGIARVIGHTWRCLICDGKTGTFDEMDDHMRTEHDFTLGTIYAGEQQNLGVQNFWMRERSRAEISAFLMFRIGSTDTGLQHIVSVVLKGRSDGITPLAKDGPSSFDGGMPLELLGVSLDMQTAVAEWNGEMESTGFFNRST